LKASGHSSLIMEKSCLIPMLAVVVFCSGGRRLWEALAL
jgi:hypothetical protein